MRRITIKDLSKHLSLSTSTISRALVNDKNIHPETKRRVLEAAEKLGYKPNLAALNLKYGQSKSIGFIVPEMVTPFSTAILRGIQKMLNPQGYRILMMQSDEDPILERQHLLFLEAFNVDAIIINLCHETYNQDVYQQILDRGTPLIFFDRIPSASLDVSKVIVDDHVKASLMVEHLVEIGRKRIVHIMGPSSIRNAIERAVGYQRILTKHQLYDPALTIKTTGIGFEDGRNAVQQLMNKKVEFDAIFAFTDTLAIGAMNYLLENKVKIPDEIAIASFSGTELSTIVYPPLTTVEQPLVEMGEAAAELTLEKIRDKATKNRTVVLTPKLVYRGSTEMKQY